MIEKYSLFCRFLHDIGNACMPISFECLDPTSPFYKEVDTLFNLIKYTSSSKNYGDMEIKRAINAISSQCYVCTEYLGGASMPIKQMLFKSAPDIEHGELIRKIYIVIHAFRVLYDLDAINAFHDDTHISILLSLASISANYEPIKCDIYDNHIALYITNDRINRTIDKCVEEYNNRRNSHTIVTLRRDNNLVYLS